ECCRSSMTGGWQAFLAGASASQRRVGVLAQSSSGAAFKFHNRGMRGLKRLMEDHAGVGAQRPFHLAEHARSRDQFDLNGVMLDEAECPFKHKTAQRLVDNLCALKAAAAMDKGVGLDGCARTGDARTLGWRLHVVSRIERSGMRTVAE